MNNSLVRLTRGLISLSSDNHMDNNLKKIREVKFNIMMSNVRFFFFFFLSKSFCANETVLFVTLNGLLINTTFTRILGIKRHRLSGIFLMLFSIYVVFIISF